MISKGTFAFRYLYHLLFSNLYCLGARVLFGKDVTILNGNHIYLGNKVHLEKNVTLKFLEEFNEHGYKIPNLRIDDGVFVATGTIIAAAKNIHIKKNTMIGPYCFIGDHDHEYHNVNVPIKDQGYINVKDVVIEEGVWIAANATICSGVTIGKNSVVGANSVVVNDVPPFCLVIGAPAKIVKQFNTKSKKWETK